ncbi:tRNA (guanine(9)-N(1))-methyltransferase [Entamoeba marina]
MLPSHTPSTFSLSSNLVHENDLSLTKNQIKRLKKKQQIEDQTIKQNEQRKQRRIEKKQRLKQLKQQAKEHPELNISIPYRKKKRDIKDIIVKGEIIIDCDFEDKMNDRDLKSLISFFVSCKGVGPRLNKLISNHPGTSKWTLISFDSNPIQFETNTYYLAAESTEELLDIDCTCKYIIGGIVDHNQFKKLCYGKSTSMGIKTLKLPIDKFVDCKGLKVLTVNHVFEILSKYKATHDWKETFNTTLPQRKMK